MVCACGGRYMQNTFVSVDQIITNNLDLLFGGMEIKSAHMFRTTRNADVARNEEEAEDLLEMITDEMRELRFAPFVRLEVDCEMPQDVIQRLSNELGLSNKDDVYTVCGQMALGDLDSLPVKLGVDSPLIFTPWSPKTHPRLQGSVSTQHLKENSHVHSLGLNLSVLTHIRFKCDDASCKRAPFPFQQLVAKKNLILCFAAFALQQVLSYG
jgi:polyphosphate kinase